MGKNQWEKPGKFDPLRGHFPTKRNAANNTLAAFFYGITPPHTTDGHSRTRARTRALRFDPCAVVFVRFVGLLLGSTGRGPVVRGDA